ncbi:MAG: DUF2178 domain-containing protein [Candidatus Nanohaloarchaea archaeon]
MSDAEDAFNIMRLGVASLILPLILLASAAMFYAGRWKIGVAALIVSALFGYLAWMNVKRVLRDDPVNDERMKKVNTHAAATSFWTIFNLGMLSFIAHMIFGITLETIPASREQIITSAPGLFIEFITLLYFGFRAYYKNFGIDSKFWRLD